MGLHLSRQGELEGLEWNAGNMKAVGMTENTQEDTLVSHHIHYEIDIHLAADMRWNVESERGHIPLFSFSVPPQTPSLAILKFFSTTLLPFAWLVLDRGHLGGDTETPQIR